MRWSSNLSYAIGLITTDGSLSIDRRHINLTSKDIEQVENFAKILHLKNKIGLKYSSYAKDRVYYQIQFGSVKLYKFLESIGLTPNKTKTLNSLKVPDKFFVDFLRGHLDGDGYTYSYFDPRWKSSFMLYMGFISASRNHLEWIKAKIVELCGVEGKLRFQGKSTYTLKFAKKSSIILLRKMYYKNNLPCLQRKRLKILLALDIIKKQAEVGKLVDPLP